ncbi:MAG TPA: phosphoribosylanthranilate isomerase [Terracidiphilus sp.]|jgi:phosphoribosylanthranilate isomerase
MSLWIKICANTSIEDALLAAEAGADAVGFVFAPSPRRVTPVQVEAIVQHLPAALEKIGVFVDASFEEIAATVEQSGLTGVQLHFDAAEALPARLRERFGSGLRILRVVHCAPRVESGEPNPGEPYPDEPGPVSGHDFSRAENAKGLKGASAPEAFPLDPGIDAILVDTSSAKARGGTGKTFDWVLAGKTLFQNANAQTLLIAAGGLTPENVAEAISILNPWGVDVVSGVEAAPGRKDSRKVRAFIANARAAKPR